MATSNDHRWRAASRRRATWGRPALAGAAVVGAALLACGADEGAMPRTAARAAATTPATGAFCVLGDLCDRHPGPAAVDGSPLGLTSDELPALAGDVETATFAVG